MNDHRPHARAKVPVPETLVEPDVWYGEDGIDALIWADPLPYRDPAPDLSAPHAPGIGRTA